MFNKKSNKANLASRIGLSMIITAAGLTTIGCEEYTQGEKTAFTYNSGTIMQTNTNPKAQALGQSMQHLANMQHMANTEKQQRTREKVYIIETEKEEEYEKTKKYDPDNDKKLKKAIEEALEGIF